MSGFALPEYVVPKSGLGRTINGGTIPKASTEFGGMLAEIKRVAKNPGPEQYNKDCLNKPFSQSKGGAFSKLAREYPKGNMKNPAVGTYETASPLITPRTKGGLMTKTERGCLFYDQAISDSKWKPAPGKYETEQKGHIATHSFHHTTTESRTPKKPSVVGPGYYDVDRRPVEKRVPVYSSSHEATKSYLDTHVKGKDKLPAPGHFGPPEAKNEDRQGRRKHLGHVLQDRHVTPRPELGYTF
mmetsp:Transcript_20389/g.43494  ORF Transcript_20389/g.43494 Transcript_20389/m.43494 type:complete len:242 (-) Transcript_20389:229-954(-)|eukprot:CAMPEP_0206532986 /NCGR_PEP_ID=MMETSP0325_2-20121206/4698_1 /ASSEMBLY_ACC=CAM_ASM_000347 /TAXON_ID=2866 /ORGANISM="Crypthecodinium cohnii, Strain Seligo" /LENGTH=241 /DNA_ID=CAMNT_0054029547 /DNA_START=75 /DNA_END=800 /DNA_ORIENTATION=+